ncbi:MAG: competence/damage-inducible protein A [Acidimicrobiales bacterium]
MRAEIVAVGTELLLGQIVDTNSTWIAEQLASAGVDCLFQTRVGDNLERIVEALQVALGRSEAVVVCGGLGPTQDDITREAIAAFMGVPIRRDPGLLAAVEAVFAARGRQMAAINAKQADLPVGAVPIEQRIGTAPGLVCPVGEKVVYALPGVPDELREMVERAVLPDLLSRTGEQAVIASRTLRTWGTSESGLAEIVAPRLDALDAAGPGAPTIAFLASGIEGIKLRLTVKAPSLAIATSALDAEEAEIRALVGEVVFGVDDETMEHAVGALLVARGRTLAVAESFTGGLIASRIVALPGASLWFRGAVVAYASEVKHAVLAVPEGPVVTPDAAAAMAEGVRRLLGADVGVATTGVAGPEAQEGLAPGTGFAGIALPGSPPDAVALRLSGSRERIRQIGTISTLDELRRRLLAET